MKQYLYAAVLLLLCCGSTATAQQLLPVSGASVQMPSQNARTVSGFQAAALSATTNCGPDTVAYAITKATGLRTLNINSATSARSGSQYFDTPQPITVSGFDFYGYSITLPSLTVTCELYLAGTDSLPTGTALASTTVLVDSAFGGGSLNVLRKSANFSTPVTVTAPYVIVMDNNSSNQMGLVCNDYTAADGTGEWLAGVRIGANWLHSYDVNVGTSVFNADWLFEPVVTYDLEANFTSSTSCVNSANTTVNFTNASSPILGNRMYNLAAFFGIPGASVNWNFGDGNSVQQVLQTDTSHTYANAGEYTVTLTDTMFTWTGVCIADTTRDLGAFPIAAYSASGTNLTYNFTDQSTRTPTSWLWDFGDGNTSTQQNPSHTYASTGTYQVCLTVTNACGSDSSCAMQTAVCPVPGAAFSSTTNLLTASFTDASSGSGITGWLWDFGDGNTSTQQNPTHVYAAAGTYTVCLTTTNSCGSDSSCSSLTITCPAPAAAFSSTSSALSASFTDASSGSGITGWLWDFGDGNTSTTQNPVHMYAAPGIYTVCLTITDSCGSDSSCSPVTISCPAPTAAFTSTTSMLTADFTDASTGMGLSYSWDFGDGNMSTQQNPQHTYAAAGTYTVCLTITNVCGSDSSCQSVTVMSVGMEAALASAIAVYPNPAGHEVRVEVALGSEEFVQLDLFNAIGEHVRELSMRGSQPALVLEVADLPAGAYFLRFRTAAATVTKRLQIMR